MPQLGTRRLHISKSLRWVLLALAIMAVVGVSLAPRLSTIGHAAAAPVVPIPPKGPRAGIFTLTSSTFKYDHPIPASSAFNSPGCVGATGAGQNIPPTLSWVNGATGFTGFPTQSYALTIVDYDAPFGGGFHHWVIYNIPGNASTLDATTIAESTEGVNDFGGVGYGGPCPPGDGQTHHYIFTLYALDVANVGGPGMTYQQLANAIQTITDPNTGQPFITNGATILIGTFTNPASS